MATADLLLELMFSWLKKRESCAEQLLELAKELESLREKCNAGETLGSTSSVIGAACLIGAGAATVFTGGAAAPFLGFLGATYTGVGIAATVTAKLTEHFSSSSTMKKAESIENESNKIAERIQECFQQLKEERQKVSSCTDPDEMDRHVMTEVLGAMARRSGLKLKRPLNFFNDVFDNGPQLFGGGRGGGGNMGLNHSLFEPGVMVAFAGILMFFTFKGSGKQYKLLFAEGAKRLIKSLSSTGFKTALKGGALAVGGAVGLAFSLPEAIDNWKDLVKNNYVTEASQSLRDTSKAIQKITETLRKQLEEIKKTFEKLAEVKRCIGARDRSPAEKQKLQEFIRQHCQSPQVVQWLDANSQWAAVFTLLDMIDSLEKEIDKDEKDFEDNIHLIFVAHGSIQQATIPAQCLLPLPTVKDVLLYSPWNCLIDACAAYGIATGLIQPQHRAFFCTEREYCPLPDWQHAPSGLPLDWNSMKRAGGVGQVVPNIIVSTLKPQDGAWAGYMCLTNTYGQPSKNRLIIPFALPFHMEVPFFVVTLVLSVVLFFSRFKATVHLAACLGKESVRTGVDEAYLRSQYACCADHTGMTYPEYLFVVRDPVLFTAFKAVFG